MKIVLSCNDNPGYRDYWPFVRDTWLHWGYDPVLFHVANKPHFQEDRVINLQPIPLVSDDYQSRVARIYGCTLFPDDVCITADIDLFLIQGDYLRNLWNQHNPDGKRFLCYSWGVYSHPVVRCQMSYIGATGRLWKDLINESDWSKFVGKFDFRNYADTADEMNLSHWIYGSKQGMICLQRKMGDFTSNRFRPILDRIRKHDNLALSKSALIEGGYIDVTCPTPFSEHEKSIKAIWAEVAK